MANLLTAAVLAGQAALRHSAAARGTCSGFAPGVAGLPVEQLSKIVDATEDQRAAFEDLKAAVAKASDVLKGSCPAEAPLTPVARLDAMEHRLQAMQAANEAVRGPLERLYNLFTAEQKQRLDKVSRARTAKAGRANIGELCSDRPGLPTCPPMKSQIRSRSTAARSGSLKISRAFRRKFRPG